MATFLTRREAQQRAKSEREEKRAEKRKYNDLCWAVKRRLLTEREVYELYKLSEKYSTKGPEQLEFELGEMMKLQDYYRRRSGNSNDPHLNALQKHLADHEARTEAQNRQASKKLVYAHPVEKLAAKAG